MRSPPPPTHQTQPPPAPCRQFCLLEPELICRLVWVKGVELQQQGDQAHELQVLQGRGGGLGERAHPCGLGGRRG